MRWTPPLPAGRREQQVTVVVIIITGVTFLFALVKAFMGPSLLWVAIAGALAFVMLRLVVAHLSQEKE